ncbi:MULTISPECIES: preprotein translocase subunit SecE [Alteromonas]|jgi:preprotein translocase subunit SecE|uniref:Protein translocase subunit SecE n=1 Tax=Alteromonas stellipolaris TaxID=233316 RepID=A0AAW7Z0Q8_9ALTE|nr:MULTISPECIES: preprotein translocase subunit SecE [Alteromonas]AMJ92185.1 preprotein translocase subunit SecE [Alteromonas sp. Mac2]ALM92894.1 Preprotein translocase subunit SecE [Alteromonas stellipolaris LMG 21856]AMJ75903.1 preprotein translocase subunit SecE [Alteromonas stellipolaris]AMJ88330.1 preprotein translocase subunit SecE [Alteromonas sp. Mac1]ANB20951.1 preprotein translocase subunit SecE [Alteromonas stellipolaris]|tara:strand:+ start:7226 stop:7603 length:378 start_codon:yes stop_codon:yes gene_type:complete
MSEKTENQSNALDMFKWVVVFALLAGLVTANTVFGEISVLYRAVTAVVVVVIAGFIAASTVKGSTFLSFAKESRTEVRKVVWPTRQEANQTTIIVLAATLVMALILWGLDGIIVRVVGYITGIGA